MSASDDDSEKQFEATQKKLDDARKRGEIAKSTDLNTAVSYFSILIVATVFGAESLQTIGATLAALLENADHLSGIFFSDSASDSRHLLLISSSLQ